MKAKYAYKMRREPNAIELLEVEVPKPEQDEVLVEVKACGICGSDVRRYVWIKDYPEYHLPEPLGHEYAGVIAELGDNVGGGWQVGERVVVGDPSRCGGRCINCLQGKTYLCLGPPERPRRPRTTAAFGKYTTVPSRSLHKLPEGISWAEGGLLQPFCLTMHGYENSTLKAGDTVAVIGPGPVGLCSVVTSKLAGASQILLTGLGIDKERLSLGKEVGADAVVNVEEESPVERMKELSDGRGADVVFDCSNSSGGFHSALELAKRGGCVTVINASFSDVGFNIRPILYHKELKIHGTCCRTPTSWLRGINAVAGGKANIKPIITHELPLDRIIEGFELCVDRKGVKVIITP